MLKALVLFNFFTALALKFACIRMSWALLTDQNEGESLDLSDDYLLHLHEAVTGPTLITQNYWKKRDPKCASKTSLAEQT
jgi:hypothetical protein